MADRKFASYDEFFLFYLTQHSDGRNRALHATGTITSLTFVAVMFAIGHAWYALLWPVIAYSFAWTGHFLIEHNKPATFGHPFWSFISDFRMVGLILTGKMSERLAQATRQEASSIQAESN
jgi:hypothetical protein